MLSAHAHNLPGRDCRMRGFIQDFSVGREVLEVHGDTAIVSCMSMQHTHFSVNASYGVLGHAAPGNFF